MQHKASISSRWGKRIGLGALVIVSPIFLLILFIAAMLLLNEFLGSKLYFFNDVDQPRTVKVLYQSHDNGDLLFQTTEEIFSGKQKKVVLSFFGDSEVCFFVKEGEKTLGSSESFSSTGKYKLSELLTSNKPCPYPEK
ncbi:hypothetical protein FJZ48_00125 [Candidatus Uhrbacteria bacterium]|nr:hypothetical protein [Candidatus Uhrbacteria bacterium]